MQYTPYRPIPTRASQLMFIDQKPDENCNQRKEALRGYRAQPLTWEVAIRMTDMHVNRVIGLSVALLLTSC